MFLTIRGERNWTRDQSRCLWLDRGGSAKVVWVQAEGSGRFRPKRKLAARALADVHGSFADMSLSVGASLHERCGYYLRGVLVRFFLLLSRSRRHQRLHGIIQPVPDAAAQVPEFSIFELHKELRLAERNLRDWHLELGFSPRQLVNDAFGASSVGERCLISRL
jgi:hypothetical protein